MSTNFFSGPLRILPVGSSLTTLVGWLVLALLTGLSGTDQARAYQLLNPPAQVSDAEKAVLTKILQDHWSRQGSAQAVAAFDEAPSSPAVLLGMALHRFEHGTVDAGLKLSQQLNQQFPQNLDGWMLTLWYQSLTDEYDKSLVSMISFQAVLQRQADLTTAQRVSIYRRIGHLIGYLEGPVSDSVTPNLLDQTKNKLLQGVKPKVVKAFNEAREAVQKRYADLKQGQQAKAKVELKQIGIQNDQEAERLRLENERLAETRSQLEPQRSEIRDRGNIEISDLERRATSVQGQLGAVNANGFNLERDLAFLYAEWNYNHERDFHGNDFFLRTQIRQLEFALSQTRSRAFGLANELAALWNQVLRVRRNINAQLKQLDTEIQRANKAIRRNDGRLSRLARGPKIPDGRSSGRNIRLTSLRTYDDLSLELYRQELLTAIQ